jgi:Protein of unknown function/GLTT repeat (6 copies)
MAQCGDKPKQIAFGVAPLGIISIGIVPMGVVSIGVVPMGVISIGVVGMGVLNACVVGMGVVVAGVHAMGIWSLTPGNGHPHHSGGAAQQQLMAYTSRQVAQQKARELGCEGVHAMGDLWMPCSEHPAHHSTNQP